MNNVLDFIRDLDMQDYGITWWQGLIGFIVFLLILVGFRKLVKDESTKKIINITINVFSYGFFLIVVLRAFLKEDYGKIVGLSILLVMSHNLVDKFYTLYDRLVDKFIDKTT